MVLQAGSLAQLAEIKCLPDYSVLIPPVQRDASQAGHEYILLPIYMVQQHLAEDTFEFANGILPEHHFGEVDFTAGDSVMGTNPVDERDLMACGSFCRPCLLRKGEANLIFIEGGAVPLVWGRTLHGDVYVKYR